MSMHPSLLASKQQFKKQLLKVQPVVKKTPTAAAGDDGDVKPSFSKPKKTSGSAGKQVKGKLGLGGKGVKYDIYGAVITDTFDENTASLSALLQRIVNSLRSRVNAPHSLPDVEDLTGISISNGSHPGLLQAIKTNPKLDYDEIAGTLTYHPTYRVYNKDDLLKLLCDFSSEGKNGVTMESLLEGYPDVEDGADELVSEGLCAKIPRAKKHLLFYVDPQYNMVVDDDIRKLWSDVRVPAATVLERMLCDEGVVSQSTRQIKRKKVEGGRRGRRGGGGRAGKIMNTHIDFDNLQKSKPPPS